MVLSKLAALAGATSAAIMQPFGAKGGNFQIDFNPNTKNLEFEVTVPRNTWFGIAYGQSMINTDILWISAG